MTCVNLQVACLGWYRENQPMSTDERKIAKGIFFINKYHWFVISDSTMKINKTKKKKKKCDNSFSNTSYEAWM